MDSERQQALIQQMERQTHKQAYALFLYNPIQLSAVNKAVEFVPYQGSHLTLAETSVTTQHWSVRKQKAAGVGVGDDASPGQMAQLRRIVVNSISGSEQPEAKKARLQRTEKNPDRTFSARCSWNPS